MKILIPLPSYGFDPTEAAVPWKLLTEHGLQVTFATPKGTKAAADRIMVTGKGLKIFSNLLKARKDALQAYREMQASQAFTNPQAYPDVVPDDYAGIYLPGGHDKGVKEYLEAETLQNIIPHFFMQNKKVGAICHGVILLARSINPMTHKPVIYPYKTTALLKSQELLAYNLTRLWLDDYYLTYPGLTVEDEVKAALQSAAQFVPGPQPLFRDTRDNLRHGFAVRDRNYLSARWPGDIYTFTHRFITMLNE